MFLTFFCCAAGTAQVINKGLPIKGDNGQVYLSPPLIDPTGQCSTRVKISSFIPGATIHVYLTATQAGPVSPKKLIGGPTALAVNGMTVHLTQALKALDELEATQTFLGVTSALSAPMTADPMLASLPEPTIDDKNIYACGVIAPVYNLLPGVTVKVFDKTAGGATIGTNSTPDDWGSNWDPVLTSALDASPKTSTAHDIDAQQLACNGATSNPGPAVGVQPQPATVNQPNVQSAIVGNNTVTLKSITYRSNRSDIRSRNAAQWTLSGHRRQQLVLAHKASDGEHRGGAGAKAVRPQLANKRVANHEDDPAARTCKPDLPGPGRRVRAQFDRQCRPCACQRRHA